MTTVLLALAAALAYGSSDFIGGLVSRRGSAWSVAVVVQLASAVVATAAGQVWLADDPSPDAVVSWRTGTGRHHVVGGPPPPGAVPA